MEYRVLKFGSQWAIWARTSRAFVLFGPKREMKQRAEALNRGHRR